MIQLEVVHWRPGNFDRVSVGNQALKPNLHLFTLAKRFLYEVGLAL